ncbi:hypothetical protein DaAHT2_1840 [Desulfurivibrio alkaliphilus AHT 2]|uniref:Uncharacterized protein n=1 Tax=Desulfurivibrio alkaliphilus (strain DSM 19089 / UNIQEM U267 / AHT2) TaxID=589865 RepID=D6Z4P6_DESAT|nr:hypothetical protein DaAHT2_1840 [Desulfurivibrio alkaliphilus AHT 2]
MEAQCWWLRVFGQLGSAIVFCADIPLGNEAAVPIQSRYHLPPEAALVSLSPDRLIVRNAGKSMTMTFHGSAEQERQTASPPFDPVKFALEDQSRALVTSLDGKCEESNMLCRNLVINCPQVMVARFGDSADVAVDIGVGSITIEAPVCGRSFPGGQFSINWSHDRHVPGCNVEFESTSGS